MGQQSVLRLSVAEQEELRKQKARDSRLERLLAVREKEKKVAEERRRKYQSKLQEGLNDLQVRREPLSSPPLLISLPHFSP